MEEKNENGIAYLFQLWKEDTFLSIVKCEIKDIIRDKLSRYEYFRNKIVLSIKRKKREEETEEEKNN